MYQTLADFLEGKWIRICKKEEFAKEILLELKLDIIKVVEEEQFQPEVIFTHHGGDVNVDHQFTFQAVITACRPMDWEKVNTIIAFETPCGTDWRPSRDPHHFIPNLFIGLSGKNVQSKIKGMEFYEFEKRSYPPSTFA